ncbi:MAG: ABC transporter permease [Actinobacteria bacterium]|nr:ABC transporter permease [Actinomycetota bacterium]
MRDAFSIDRLSKEFERALVIAKKDIRIYCLKPPVILFGLVFPFFLFLAFYVGKKGSIAEGIPGLVAISVFFASSNIAPAGMPYERMAKTFNRYLSAPISISWVAFGKTLAGFTFGIAVSMIPLLVGIIGFGTGVSSPTVLVFGLIAGALCFSCLGTLVATMPTEAPGNIMTVLNFIRLPLLFMSGIFVALSAMPGWARGLAAASPLTYAGDLLRHATANHGYFPIWLDFTAIMLFTVVFYGTSVALFKLTRSR